MLISKKSKWYILINRKIVIRFHIFNLILYIFKIIKIKLIIKYKKIFFIIISTINKIDKIII